LEKTAAFDILPIMLMNPQGREKSALEPLMRIVCKYTAACIFREMKLEASAGLKTCPEY
jgi:hypothetical protein